jgi:hypothetical protein
MTEQFHLLPDDDNTMNRDTLLASLGTTIFVSPLRCLDWMIMRSADS